MQLNTEPSNPQNESGYIVVAVRTADGALPIENAVVTVKDSSQNILYVVFTDNSGKTPKLRVIAPARQNSQSPNTNEPPFYTYNIDTDKPGYISVRNQSVPVYPGVTSIQPVELLAQPEGVTEPGFTYNESGTPDL